MNIRKNDKMIERMMKQYNNKVAKNKNKTVERETEL